MRPRRRMLAALLFVAACGPRDDAPTDEGQLRRRAAFDFDCPAGEIALTHLGGAGPPHEQWGAAGCGQRAVYRCAARDTTASYPRGVCVWQREWTGAPPTDDAGPRDG